jgi:hypothetical protein
MKLNQVTSVEQQQMREFENNLLLLLLIASTTPSSILSIDSDNNLAKTVVVLKAKAIVPAKAPKPTADTNIKPIASSGIVLNKLKNYFYNFIYHWMRSRVTSCQK